MGKYGIGSKELAYLSGMCDMSYMSSIDPKGERELLNNLTSPTMIYDIPVEQISALNNPSQACMDFAYGASRLLPAALAIGLVRSVMVLMTQAKIVDTAIHQLALALEGKGLIAILFIVYIAGFGRASIGWTPS